MRRLIRTIFASLILMSVMIASPVYGQIHVYGVGVKTCGWVLENKKQYKGFIENWITGYVSGVNRIHSVEKRLAQIKLPLDVLFYSVLKQCRERPKVSLENAISRVLLNEWESLKN